MKLKNFAKYVYFFLQNTNSNCSGINDISYYIIKESQKNHVFEEFDCQPNFVTVDILTNVMFIKS